MKKLFDYLDKIANKHKEIDGHIQIHSHGNWELYNSAKEGLDYLTTHMFGDDPRSKNMVEVTEGTYRGIRITIYSPDTKNPRYIEPEPEPLYQGPGEFVAQFIIYDIKSKSPDLVRKKMSRLHPVINKIFGSKLIEFGVFKSHCGFDEGAKKIFGLKDKNMSVDYDKEKKELIIKNDMQIIFQMRGKK